MEKELLKTNGGIESTFTSEFSGWDEAGEYCLQFYDCVWTKYSKLLIGEDHKDYDLLVIDTTTSVLEFHHSSGSESKIKKFSLTVEATPYVPDET